MGRMRRFSSTTDGDGRRAATACASNPLSMLFFVSLFFASSTAMLSCANDAVSCSPLDVRAVFQRPSESLASCDTTPPAAEEAPTLPPIMNADASAPLQPPPPPQTDATTPPTDSSSSTTTPDATSTTMKPDAKQIATFDEWTKQKLQQEQLKAPTIVQPAVVAAVPPVSGGAEPHARVHVPVPPEAVVAVAATASRNYASRECGAKVIYANPEAENTKAVLNDKEKDDYMRNPCDKAQHKQLVIEMCETIQPRTIDIANFELFSSGPASVRFSAAERFPNAQWTVLGEWTIADTRSVHTLTVPADKRIYSKFIKLDLLSHHGAEHYCTLSLVRVLGVSMVDEYEAEATAVASRLTATATHAESVAAEQPPQQTQQEPEKKQTEEVEKPPPAESSTETPPTTSLEAPPTVVVTPPAEPVVAPSSTATTTQAPDAAAGLVQEVMSGKLLKKIIEVVGGGGGGTNKGGVESVESRKNSRAESLYASCARTDATSAWANASCPRVHFFCPMTSRKRATGALLSTAPSAVASRRMRARRARVAGAQRRVEAERVASALPPPPAPAVKPSKVTASELPASVVPPPVVAATPVKEEKKTEQIPKSPQPVPKPVVTPAPASAANAVPSAVPPASPSQAPPTATTPTQTTPTIPTAPVPTPSSATPAAPTQPHPPASIFDGLPAGTSSHKESVFMKLNKRIAALELNMSLSSEYLSELSRQYIAHTDEQKRAMERTRLSAERAAIDAAKMLNETVKDELFTLRKEMDAISVWLATLRAHAGGVALAPRRIAASAETILEDEEEEAMRYQRGDGDDVMTSSSSRRGGGGTSGDPSAHETCPNRVHRSRRVHGPQPRPQRVVADDDVEGDEEEEEEVRNTSGPDEFHMRHFDHHSDGIWTTEQVLYAVLGAQALTVCLVLALQFCYQRLFGLGGRRGVLDTPASIAAAAPASASPAPAIDRREIERLIALALEERLARDREEDQLAPVPLDPPATTSGGAAAQPQSSASSVTSASSAEKRAGKRRQRRKTGGTASVACASAPVEAVAAHHQCRQCGGPAPLDWDSAMDSSLPSPSQTGSEEEEDVGRLAPPTSGHQAPPLAAQPPSSLRLRPGGGANTSAPDDVTLSVERSPTRPGRVVA